MAGFSHKAWQPSAIAQSHSIRRRALAKASSSTCGSLSLDHSIVAQNTGANGDINGLLGTTITARYSLIGNNQGSGLTAPVAACPMLTAIALAQAPSPINPRLGPLADNGGPTKTHALLADSPAIDTGDPAAVAGAGSVPQFDQRGEPFGRVSGQIDIGAVRAAAYVAGLLRRLQLQRCRRFRRLHRLRKMLGSSVAPYSGADGNGNGIVDQLDLDMWKAHFGQTVPPPPATGGGAAAATVAAPAACHHRASATMPIAQPVADVAASERTLINKPRTSSAREAALATLDLRPPVFARRVHAQIRRADAAASIDSGIKLRRDELLLTRLALAKLDTRASDNGQSTHSANSLTKESEAVETPSAALDAALATLAPPPRHKLHPPRRR